MDLSNLFWGWLILAMFLFILEIFTAGFVLAAFGVGALGGAFIALLDFSLPVQLAVFIVVSIVAVMFSRRFAERVSGEQPQRVGVDRVLGKRAVVLETIDHVAGAGRVRVDQEEWRALSRLDEPIPAGSIVEVVGIEGTRLIVQPHSTIS